MYGDSPHHDLNDTAAQEYSRLIETTAEKKRSIKKASIAKVESTPTFAKDKASIIDLFDFTQELDLISMIFRTIQIFDQDNKRPSDLSPDVEYRSERT